MTIQELRQFLFALDNQQMTVEELRGALFGLEEDHRVDRLQTEIAELVNKAERRRGVRKGAR